MQLYLNASNPTKSTNAINCSVLVAQWRLNGTQYSQPENY